MIRYVLRFSPTNNYSGRFCNIDSDFPSPTDFDRATLFDSLTAAKFFKERFSKHDDLLIVKVDYTFSEVDS